MSMTNIRIRSKKMVSSHTSVFDKTASHTCHVSNILPYLRTSYLQRNNLYLYYKSPCHVNAMQWTVDACMILLLHIIF